ncbi:conserved membrane hypothetical protein [Cupriavidus taiwanensis]|uniref:DUF6708 domain-containing protein n=1 Tax=Cupriavidus taiwanensis TaxID=164546 RepID=A0A375E689_9BURK|nr:DUF6708 domain-containing protein [Cupriavidus taiwanensis]SOZ63295.1 conserved membrane hypothetical protein [Cupriavidus taiwanensis]SOZ64216.1 conserved membrane hypothetical protein [Cupriavidus taiwanensis]SOZ67982.1 conserved membrane hypothetical protein [Cupriavidus taiwanensis]SPA01381.1 conserved membrane hypothetical protein [Cupriavidus taiwanensis]SPA07846.1 conserved membrane hypothetical protein [Cupriavidus taiwanensis]
MKEGEYAGWLTRYKINRPLREYEVEEHLSPKQPVSDLPPNDHGLLRVNSTFVEYMDRFFLQRGWAAFAGAPIVAIGIFFGGLFASSIYATDIYGREPDLTSIISGWIGVIALAVITFIGMKFAWLKDFFRYTHYPIRFNRRNRMVYVFRHNGVDGVLAVPWDKAHFFIGRSSPVAGGQGHYTFDLRCNVLDEQRLVRDTFAIGMDGGTSRGAVLEHWEMVRRYMEEGPQSLPFPPLALTVSTETTLRNMVITQVSGQFSGVLSILMLPITLPWAFFRYLVMKTCKRPIWPEDVEAACTIDPNDPFVLEEPRYAGDARTSGPAGDEQFLAYREGALKMALEYDAERRDRLGPDGTAA